MDDKIVTIFGTSRAGAGDAIFTLAYETGKLLAQAGFTVANGGYGGTMLAAAKGAAKGPPRPAVKSSALRARRSSPAGPMNMLLVKLLPARSMNGSIRS